MRQTGILQRLNDFWWHLYWMPRRLLFRRRVRHRRLLICLVIFILLYLIGIVLNPVVEAYTQRKFAERGLVSSIYTSSYLIYDTGKVYCLEASSTTSQNMGHEDGSILARISLACRVDTDGWPAPLAGDWRITERWSLRVTRSREELLHRYLAAIGRDDAEADFRTVVLDAVAAHSPHGEVIETLKKQPSLTSTWISWPGLAYNVMVTPLLPLGLYLLWGWWVFWISRNWRRAAKGRCPVCGYSLRGIEPDRCPECGHRMTVKERDLIARKYGESEA